MNPSFQQVSYHDTLLYMEQNTKKFNEFYDMISEKKLVDEKSILSHSKLHSIHFTAYMNIKNDSDSIISSNEDILFESFDSYNKKINKAGIEKLYNIDENILQPLSGLQKNRNMIINKFNAIINENLNDISLIEENLKKVKKQNMKTQADVKRTKEKVLLAGIYLFNYIKCDIMYNRSI